VAKRVGGGRGKVSDDGEKIYGRKSNFLDQELVGATIILHSIIT
jgi:hypothetical protein